VKSLRRNEQELIFDYFLGFTTDSEIEQAQQLLQSSKGAAEFYSKLQSSLEPLDHYAVETCPEHLAEATISRLNAAALDSQSRLEHLLQKEQQRTKPVTASRSFWSNFVEVAAIAAMIFVVAGISFPTLQNARQNYWKTKCSSQLASMATGISQYAADHDQSMPTVATASGSPWWKVGYQGAENQSNTRHLWLLVQSKYVEPEAFVCPARIQGKASKLDRTQVSKLSDFPNRKYVTYSFRIVSDKNANRLTRGNQVLISDMNPVFENLPRDYYKDFDLKVDDQMLKANSVNHRDSGQNVLLSDGSVSFHKDRQIGNDDIFTVKGQTHYRGTEAPTLAGDNFLAP
jgi:hypothetical protein